MFTDESMPVSASDRERIIPLGEDESRIVWKERISGAAEHPMLLSNDDKLRLFQEKREKAKWSEAWNLDSSGIPEALESIEWNEQSKVYFAYSSSDIILTDWSVFKRNWKCFLFEDEGPLLFSKSNEIIVSFGPDGYFTVYSKSQSAGGINSEAAAS